MRQKTAFTSGFTLVETLLYFALVAVLLTTLTTLFITMLEVKVQSNSISRVERDSMFIQSRLAHDIRKADLILEPAAVGSISGQLQLRIDGDDVTYAVVNGELTYSKGATVAAAQTQTTIQNFSVQRISEVGGTPTVRIQFDIVSDAEVSGDPEIRSYQTTIGIR